MALTLVGIDMKIAMYPVNCDTIILTKRGLYENLFQMQKRKRTK